MLTNNTFNRLSCGNNTAKAKHYFSRLVVFLLCILFNLACYAQSSESNNHVSPSREQGRTALINVQSNGTLEYFPYNKEGDIIPDFSNCGYYGGGIPLPDVRVIETVVPQKNTTTQDDTRRIQAAIDRASNRPLQADGFRGAVLLKRGTYHISGTLSIHSSGVVLKGEGDDENGTILIATAKQRLPLILIKGKGKTPIIEIRNTQREILDDYVPVGGRTVTLQNTRGLRIGQSVYIIRRGNAAWISAIGMDRIRPRPGNPKSTRQWTPFDLKFDRYITKIQGNQVTFDAPITCSIDKKWGGGLLVCYKDVDRISNCGIEHIRAISQYDQSIKPKGANYHSDENHATYVVSFDSVKNVWARNITSLHFYHGPACLGKHSKWITVEDCKSLSPVSILTGGRRYPYHIEGSQLALVQRCYSEKARHAFVFGARVPGPNVFLDCHSTKDNGSSEPHHRWSTGGLYDNVSANIAIQDRQWMGSGHGWAGAYFVVWNSKGSLICQKPPTAQNFAIGFTGRRPGGAFKRPNGWWESIGTPVEPQSLYKAQLAERLRMQK